MKEVKKTMGIRIHKAMGYGIKNIKLNEDGDYADERINSNFYDAINDTENEHAFKDWVLNNQPECIDILSDLYFEDRKWIKMDLELLKRSMDNSYDSELCHIIEYDDKADILLIPADHYKRWFRYDDAIDYEESRLHGDGADNYSIDMFKENTSCGFYPYVGMQLKPNSLKIFSDEVSAFTQRRGAINTMEPSLYNQLTGRWDKNIPALISGDVLKHLQEDWAPRIPLVVKLYAHYFKIFNDPVHVFDLHPMLSVWWS